ncbi:50S ribosomal protein L1 [Candidatus Peribacteria bacterium RIFCSPHIGHO2_02_FULL_49_16]|nr:MAG: 50S ribosomal protein L1 [Candidatus Peribacteria bacterium RIFCSPHIGHO2_01_FULL_49_38]OGJ58546.1 MAG: 50S ribosomal protein L1 [Candidatus Peribacteria bacterium RIFCSPHIGHO2_02_FULL_49_16]
MTRGKTYREKRTLIEKESYPISQAMDLLTKVSRVKFDATAEAHIRIKADTTEANQLVRTTVNLPHGTGKTVRIAAFVPDELAKDAKAAGADIVGNEDLIAQIEKGKIEFDAAVAVPAVMKKLGKVAKILGQKGLMPNPKAGTVTDNITKTIGELKKGRIECKMDTFGIIHVPFGKISFGKEKLEENFTTLMQAITDARPAGIKGIYISSVTVCPTMGPGIKIQI